MESYKGNAAHAARLDHEYFEELRHRAEFAEKALAELVRTVESLDGLELGVREALAAAVRNARGALIGVEKPSEDLAKG